MVAFVATLLVALQAAPSSEPVTRQIDPNHSEITFRVRHLVSRVPGTFTSWGGTIFADPADLGSGRVEVTIDAASITTRNDRRDTDLRSPNFFAVDSFPKITFKSTGVEARGTALAITGDLTMRGVTRAVEGGGVLLGNDVEITINIEAIRAS